MIKKLKVNKNAIMRLRKGVLTLLATTMLASGVSGCTRTLKVEEAKHIQEVGNYGTMDTYDKGSSLTMITVSNHEIDEELLKKALEKDSTISLLVESDAKIYADIWKEVDYIKDLISTYSIKGPVYLDLDYIIDESNLDNTIAVAREFVQKLESNNIYVGVKGTDKVFQLVDDAFANQDKCLSLSYSDEAITLDDYSSIIINDSDEYYTLYNYEEIINNANLNTPDNYVSDTTYKVKEGDSLTTIAGEYDISVNNLIEYNNLDSDYITIGQELIIPNDYQTAEKEESKSKSTENESELTTYDRIKVDESVYYKGIDVSSYQGKIDWEKASEKIDFAVIRIADAAIEDENGNIVLDEYFKYNMEECNRLGIPVGVYIYSRASSEEQNNKEIKFVLDNIKDYNVILPVYRDLEGKYAEMLTSSEESRKLQVGLTEKFCDTIEKSGYASGIYLHKKYLDRVSEIMDKYSVWAQGGMYYSTVEEFDSMAYAYEESADGSLKPFDLSYGVNIFQTTQYGSIEGLGITGSEYVDYNYIDQNFVDNLIKKFDKLENVKMKRN